MDYLKAPMVFKLKKVIRYCRLYGPMLTATKIQGQIHLRRTYSCLPNNARVAGVKQTVGIIGCGNFAYSTIAYWLARRGRVLRGVMDVDLNRAASLYERWGASYYTGNADDILGDDSIRLIYIASNHASHADYAVAALKANKSVYIEKPHVVSYEQLEKLVEELKRSQGKVFLGFNRPHSRFGRIIHEVLSCENGPAVMSWFVTGHLIPPDHWYMKPGEGGRILGNVCHWIDFLVRLATPDMYPVEINPTRVERADCNVSVAYRFADGTLATIMFSEKEYAFEGVREQFCAHKGNALVRMSDFETMTVVVGDRVKRYRNWHRDQGHADSILDCYDNVNQNRPYDRAATASHVWNTGLLMLKTKEALERNSRLTVQHFYNSP
jgi:predicted dehydrogenase